MPWRCMRSATRSAAPTRRRSPLSSIRSGIGSPRGSGRGPASPLALHRWRRYGRSSPAPRGRSRCSISTGNRWFSPSSGFSPKRRADRGLFHAASVPDMASKPYYITTAIPYANGPPHIGHAYEAIATDAIARFMRLDGYDVFFLTGTDEHGRKMQQTAAEAGIGVGPGGERRGLTGSPVEWVEEESYFFRLSAYREKLLDLYQKHPDFVLPETRMNEVTSFVRGGLQDLSISRTNFDWGVPVPGDPKHVMYVWVDALTNYITGVGFPDTESEQFRRYWPADLHVIGKDILRFHAVYWPAFLMSAGLAVPRRVFS